MMRGYAKPVNSVYTCELQSDTTIVSYEVGVGQLYYYKMYVACLI